MGWWPRWSKPVEPVGSGQHESPPHPPPATAAAAPSTSTMPNSSAAAEAVDGLARDRPLPRGEGPSMTILGASAVGILGCGIMAGMYRAQRSEEKELLAKRRARLKPEEQVKFWKRPTAATTGPFGIAYPPGFNPTRFAAKALAIGTLLCVSATGALAFGVGRAMGVRDVYEFVDVVRAWAPRKRRELEAWLGVKPNLALEAERAAVARMSYDEEIEHWEKVVLVESENDDKVKGEGKGAS